MVDKKHIYADLGNLRHTDFVIIEERNGKLYSIPAEEQEAFDYIKKYSDKEHPGWSKK